MRDRYTDQYTDVRGAHYHQIAAYHHKAKAAAYSDVGLGKKAARHRRRAKWHAAFGAPEEDTARAFHSKYMPAVRKKFEGASAAIKSITESSIEVAKVPNKQKWTGNPIEHESHKMREFVEAARKSETPMKAFMELKAAHVNGEYDKRAASALPSAATVKKERHRVAYDPGRAHTKAEAARTSVRAFGRSVREYLMALRALGGTGRGRLYIDSYEEVGAMIERLRKDLASVGDRSGNIDMNELSSRLENATIHEGAWQTEDALSAGAETLVGLHAEHISTFRHLRVQPAFDPNFVLYQSDDDE